MSLSAKMKNLLLTLCDDGFAGFFQHISESQRMHLGRRQGHRLNYKMVLAGLLADGTIGEFLQRARCLPRGRLADAKRAVENIERKCQIPAGLCTFVERH